MAQHLTIGTGCGASGSHGMRMPTMPDDLTLEHRRKRLLWRACHRGMKEVDILLGGFAEHALPQMMAPELAELERLMDVPDQDLLSYATGQAAVPASIDGPLLRRILAHRPANQPVNQPANQPA